MYRFAIVDDNQDDRKKLIHEIDQYIIYHNIQVNIDEYVNAESYNFNKTYDCIFLDIDMPGKKGTTLAREIHQKINTRIIFITSFNEYLYSTLDAGAFHFIHKNNLRNEVIHVLNILLQSLNDNLMIVKTKRGQQNIFVKDIIYFHTEDKLTYIYTNDEKYEIWDSLSSLYNKYKKYNFEKINQSTLVNLDFIKTFNDKTITLNDLTILPLSQRLKKTFNERYDDYILGNNNYEFI